MASYFNLVLDTTGPQGATASINSNAAFTNTRTVSFALGTTDPDTTGYQMKIWGSIDGGPATEAAATWVGYSATNPVTLTEGDGVKTLNAKIRDDVANETAVLTATITLDTTLPVVTVGAPSVSKVSKVAGFRTATSTFQADTAFVEYMVRVVPTIGSDRTAGTQIPTTNGSTNMSDTGTFPAATNISISIDGRDLEIASGGDGTKIVKVFVRDEAGNWSS